jgi:hypothetical protein
MEPDRLVKKDGEAFGIVLGSKMELMDGTSPSGLTEQQKHTLVNGPINVVVLVPGGFVGGHDKRGGNDMQMMSVALEELVHQGRAGSGYTTKTDLHWDAASQTACRSIK